MTWEIKEGDVRAVLQSMNPGSVHCCLTSPPYWALRDYGVAGQLGSESTPGEFIETMVDVFREVRRVLRDDGTLWVNLGDTFSQGNNGASSEKVDPKNHQARRFGERPNERGGSGVPQGNQCLMPHRVAMALQMDGWILRQTIVWHKKNPMCESLRGWRWMQCRVKTKAQEKGSQASVGNSARSRDMSNGTYLGSAEYEPCPGCDKCRATGGLVLSRGSWRPTTAHEYIFLFSKTAEYFCDGDASQEATSGNAHSRGNGLNPKTKDGAVGREKQNESFSAATNGIVMTRNMRSVWSMASEPFKEAHFATFPTELVRLALTAATSKGGCCSRCGVPFAPQVVSERVATRPGDNTKVPGKNSRFYQERDSQHSGEYKGERYDLEVGNRDPQRHVAITRVLGYLPCCTCQAPPGPSTVLDCFSGAGTAGVVARRLGLNYVGIELNPQYAAMSRKRIRDDAPLFNAQGNP